MAASSSVVQKKEKRIMYNVFDITQKFANENNWTVVVQLVQKYSEKEFTNKVGATPTRFRNFVATDAVGTRVGLVSYARALKQFNPILVPYKRYRISNAQVNMVRPKFQIGDYKFSWNLTQTTLVELIEERIPPPLPCVFALTRFSEFRAHLNHVKPINVRGLVIQALPIVDISNTGCSKDMIIIDEEMKPMVMRIWDDLLENAEVKATDRFNEPTLIIALNVKVATYYGVSLATRNDTYIMRNPPLQEGKALKDWYYKNEIKIQVMLQKQMHKDSFILLPPPEETEIISIAEAKDTLEMIRTTWIYGTMSLQPIHQKMTYIACGHCFRSMNGGEDWEIICSNCGSKTILESRCHIPVLMNDETCSIETTLFTPTAEKLTKFTGRQIAEAEREEIPLALQIDEILKEQPFYCFLKYSEKIYKETVEPSFQIVSVYTRDEIDKYRMRVEAANIPNEGIGEDTAKQESPQKTDVASVISALTDQEPSLLEPTEATPTSIINPAAIAITSTKESSPRSEKSTAKRSLNFDHLEKKHGSAQEARNKSTNATKTQLTGEEASTKKVRFEAKKP